MYWYYYVYNMNTTENIIRMTNIKTNSVPERQIRNSEKNTSGNISRWI